MSDDKLKEPKEDEDALAGEDGEEGGEGEEGGKDKKKLILMIAVPIVLLLGGGAAAFFTGALDGLLGRDAAVEEMMDGEHGEADDAHGAAEDDGHGGKKSKKKKAKDSHGEVDSHGESTGDSHREGSVVFLEIPKMIVSLSSDDDQPRYLSLSVQLELETTDDREAIEDVMPRVVDQFQSFLRELRVQDLRGTKGLYRLKLELLGRVNAAAYPVEVKNILRQDMIVQ
jgi:flagellar FliL protein